jgi:hypothetical protein
LCVTKTGNVANKLNEPVFQHGVTSLVPSRSLSGRSFTKGSSDKE